MPNARATDRPQPHTLTPAEMRTALLACIIARQPVCIHGPVGIGKSQTVAQFVRSIGATWQLEPTARRDPTDYSGIPMPDASTRTTVWCEPSFFANARDAANSHPTLPHVIFWDEHNRAAPAVINVTLNIILENRSGEYVLPPNVCHILAVNDAQDSTGVMPMSEAQRNRVVHLYGRADQASWLDWAKGKVDAQDDAAVGAPTFAFAPDYHTVATGRVTPEVIAYIHNHPEALHDFDRHADAFPTPRSWEFVSRILDPALPPAIERALITGAIGMAHGSQFWAHLGMWRTLVGRFDVPRIIANPTTEPVPSDISSQYAVASALMRLMDPSNAANILTYVARMPAEFSVFVVLSAIKRTGDDASPLHRVGAITQWKLANQDSF